MWRSCSAPALLQLGPTIPVVLKVPRVLLAHPKSFTVTSQHCVIDGHRPQLL